MNHSFELNSSFNFCDEDAGSLTRIKLQVTGKQAFNRHPSAQLDVLKVTVGALVEVGGKRTLQIHHQTGPMGLRLFWRSVI